MIKSLLLTSYLVSSLQGQSLIEKQISSEGEIQKTTSLPLPASLLSPKNNRYRIAVIGDTGCRVRGKEVQDCRDPEAWPLEALSSAVAKDQPDFIIHVGDYHYRISCKGSKICPELEPTLGYTWVSWEADWFKPTKAISKIPTFFVRGNHENCRRAWLHWEKFLAPNPVDIDQCLDVDPFQITDLGALVLVNLDVSWVSDEALSDSESPAAQEKLRDYLLATKKDLQTLRSKGNKEVWVLIHKPPYGAVPYLKKSQQAVPDQQKQIVKNKEIFWDFGTPRLTKVLQGVRFDEVVDYYLSGHIHNVQLVSGNHPLQIIAGQSGTSLEPIGKYAKDIIPMKNGSQAFIPTAHDKNFGYLLIEKNLNAGSLDILMKDPNGNLEFKCSADSQSYNCEAAKP